MDYSSKEIQKPSACDHKHKLFSTLALFTPRPSPTHTRHCICISPLFLYMNHLLCFYFSPIAAGGDSQSQIGEAFCMAGTAATAYEIDVCYRIHVIPHNCMVNTVSHLFGMLYAFMYVYVSLYMVSFISVLQFHSIFGRTTLQ